MPDRNDQAALQKFFFDEIQKGEELLAAGNNYNIINNQGLPICFFLMFWP